MKQLLDNIAWHALAGPHAKYATGADDARRYAAGFTPIADFANAARPNFGALAAYCNRRASLLRRPVARRFRRMAHRRRTQHAQDGVGDRDALC